MQISGRNFLPELCGEGNPETAPLQALRCALCSTEQSTFRGGEKGENVPRKGEEEGWPGKGGKRKKGRVKTGLKFELRNRKRNQEHTSRGRQKGERGSVEHP